jgi:hypothetical protein
MSLGWRVGLSTPLSREVGQYPVVKEQGRARNSLAFFYTMFLTETTGYYFWPLYEHTSASETSAQHLTGVFAISLLHWQGMSKNINMLWVCEIIDHIFLAIQPITVFGRLIALVTSI